MSAAHDSTEVNTPRLVENFFRREYGQLVASLCRRVGTTYISDVEDSVQSALLLALELWPQSGVLESPGAWLFRVAHNTLLDKLREGVRHGQLLALPANEQLSEYEDGAAPPSVGEYYDDMLRLLFICCDDNIPRQSQLVLALRFVSGFDVREIAARLFMTEANVYKRLARARERLVQVPFPVDTLVGIDLAPKLSVVREIIYQLFTEGYLSSHAELSVRSELCDEAIHLATVLATHAMGADPETFALLALMHLHAARLASRTNATGDLLLLSEQDRSLWDQHQIACGLQWLAKSADGDVYTRYHAEAGIAAEHCLARSLEETRWDRIASGYAALEGMTANALHRVNRAVGIAEWRGAQAGLEVLEDFEPPAWLSESHMWSAVLSDLHRRAGNGDLAELYREAALDAASTEAVRQVLRRRLVGE